MALSKPKRPLEFSTSSSEDGGQRQSKRQAPFMPNLQIHEIDGSQGHFTLDDNGQVVREGMEQPNSNLIELIDRRIQNATMGLTTQIYSLKNEIQELVCRMDRANPHSTELLESCIQNALVGFIPQIGSLLKNAIQELVCKGTDHPNPLSLEPVERTLPDNTQITDSRNLQLRFKSKLSLPLFTKLPLKGQQGCPIQIELIDASTGRVVTSGPESCAKLDVVVLRGDFNKEDEDTWSVEEFEDRMVKEREGKQPLLAGELQVKLKEGIGELGNLAFTDNSSWNSCKNFRIGVKFPSGFCGGIRVREAVTEKFSVKDYRGKAYEKHDEPASDDEIWRLEKIGKDGKYCERLHKEGIYKVEEFVRHLVGDSKKLRNILGIAIPDKKWMVLINHANKCVPNGKSYVYYADDKKEYGVVISNICQLKGLIAGGKYHTTDQLSDSQKAHADDLVKAASKNWNQVEEFRPESCYIPVLSKTLSACVGKLSMNQQPCDDPSDCCLAPLSFPRIDSSKAPLGSSGPVSGDSTIGFGNVNPEHSVSIIPRSLMLSHNTNPTSMVSEQDANPCNQQEPFGTDYAQFAVPHESPLFFSPSPFFEGECFMEDLWSLSDNFGGTSMPDNFGGNGQDPQSSSNPFEKYIVIEREGKRPLLTGELQVELREGIGELGKLKFTDNSSWNSCKKFRIGVKVASGFCEGIRVREAITEAFLVRDEKI